VKTELLKRLCGNYRIAFNRERRRGQIHGSAGVSLAVAPRSLKNVRFCAEVVPFRPFCVAEIKSVRFCADRKKREGKLRDMIAHNILPPQVSLL
jgi:hypothetical protein